MTNRLHHTARAQGGSHWSPRISLRFIVPWLLGLVCSPLWAQIPAVWDLTDPATRAAVVEELRARSTAARAAAHARAAREGWQPKGVVDGRNYELQAIRDDRLLMYIALNVNAAISTAANLIRNTPPYNVNGSGLTVGEWDGGAVRKTHQELTGRVTLKDNVPADDHSTHVAGTIGAAGVVAAALGMAPATAVDSYEWNNDVAEMAARGMAAPGQSGTLQLSNHSYGLLSGWATGSWSGNYGPHWWGTWGYRESDNFGQYNTDAQDWDTVCYNAPYFLPFVAASNDRDDDAPAAGTVFYYYSGGWQSKSYNPATDPYSDGWDNGGYDTIPLIAVAKNILTVGAVNDAVSGGVRSLAAATMTTFSCWGPTDDGRSKPDVVANGTTLYSCTAQNNSSYASYSGTSMATPNACGSAALIVDYFGRLFPGQYLRASTLKALLLHTADDLGNPGPDYQFGWGLLNAKAAADLIRRHYDYPGARHISEAALTPAQPGWTNSFVWDLTNAIRVTLCWTDPPGPALTGLDNTNRVLVNDLDLRLVGPAGQVYLPYVLNPQNPAAAATTGVNTRDNVEQVCLAAPPGPGVYRAEVSLSGTLTGTQQVFALVVSGAAESNLNLIVSGAPWNVGSVNPSYGTNVLPFGTSVTASALAPASYRDAVSLRVYACTGWTGSGSVPAAGATNSLSFTLTNHSALVWQWVLTDLTLSNQTVATVTNWQARDTLTAGEGFDVTPGGEATLRAGRWIRLAPGFRASSGSVLRATTAPAP